MSYLIKVVGLANGKSMDGMEGFYVSYYSADDYGGKGDLVLSPRKRQAKRYPSMSAAWADWSRASRTHPTRPDGMPNRPMTAFTIEVISA